LSNKTVVFATTVMILFKSLDFILLLGRVPLLHFVHCNCFVLLKVDQTFL